MKREAQNRMSACRTCPENYCVAVGRDSGRGFGFSVQGYDLDGALAGCRRHLESVIRESEGRQPQEVADALAPVISGFLDAPRKPRYPLCDCGERATVRLIGAYKCPQCVLRGVKRITTPAVTILTLITLIYLLK